MSPSPTAHASSFSEYDSEATTNRFVGGGDGLTFVPSDCHQLFTDRSDHAHYDAAAQAVTKHGDDNNDTGVASAAQALADDERMIGIATTFLELTCPEFLDALGRLKEEKAVEEEEEEQEGRQGLGGTDARSARDRLVKVGRNVSSTMRTYRRRCAQISRGGVSGRAEAESDKTTIAKTTCVRSRATIDESLALLAHECRVLARVLTGAETRRVPKARFGRTELQMPVVTLGCMRFQQSWNRSPDAATYVRSLDDVQDECQANLVNILRYAARMGVTHIETAKGYGCSEMQLGHAIRTLLSSGTGAGSVRREDLIIQTKGGISGENMTPSEFRAQFLSQLEALQLDHVDLFSVHGLNSDKHLSWLFEHPKGPEYNLYPVLTELKKEGKLRHIGFSTHGCVDLIRRTIQTNAFDYVNLHHHFIGSYTTSGDSIDGVEGNLSNIRLAHELDIGVFIISPYDKGGQLYAPSQRLRDLTLPEMEPMTYGSLWLWRHHLHDPKGSPIHTIVCGAARPSDLDQPTLSSFLLNGDDQDATSAKMGRVSARMDRALVDATDEQWAKTWFHGLINSTDAKHGTQHGNIVWLHNVIRAYGLLDYAKNRYAMNLLNTAGWDIAKTKEENMKAVSPAWWWCPGTAYDDSLAVKGEYDSDLAQVGLGDGRSEICDGDRDESASRSRRVARILEMERFVHRLCTPAPSASEESEATKSGDDEKKISAVEDKDGISDVIPIEWETSYDMRPWTAYPERG